MYLLNDSKHRFQVPLAVLILLASNAWGSAGAVPHHQLEVWLQARTMVVEDRLRFEHAPTGGVVEFLLGDAFDIERIDAELLSEKSEDGFSLRRYRVRLAPGQTQVSLRYRGRLSSSERSIPGSMPNLVYDDQGIYLDGQSGWYPLLLDQLVTFSLTVHQPPDWRVVSQGDSTSIQESPTHWHTTIPQDEIYLLTGPYRFYQRIGSVAKAQVFLRSDDPALAERYLNATESYLDLYSRLLGPYPFEKFAAVENRWETGFGMPSFTLLGSRVMRLPFILSSSYPHEIVHNWLGNSVYPDYASGNWSEGLTSYLADHLIQEQQGRGERYRRSVLQKYADYVSDEKDFSLRQFRSRHNGASQAVGYGKTLMLFHMLRNQTGDLRFRQALRQFVQNYRHKTAGFDDLRRTFEQVHGSSLEAFFKQWVGREGAPELEVAAVSVAELGDGGYRVSGELRQTQSGNHYELQIPFAVTVKDQPEAIEEWVTMNSKRTRFALDTKGQPLRLDVDPRFDLFRKLSNAELPPSLGQIFGASKLHLMVPAAAPENERSAYLALARFWQQRYPHLTVGSDAEPLPKAGGVWLLGAGNRHASAVVTALQDDYLLADPRARSLPLEQENGSSSGRAFVVTVRRGEESTLGWMVPDGAASAAALARKLPHYGKYSYLVFAGDDARNVVKAEWPALGSPLTRILVPEEQVTMGRLNEKPPLVH